VAINSVWLESLLGFPNYKLVSDNSRAEVDQKLASTRHQEELSE